MSLDPTLAAALVTASGGIIANLVERLPWGGKKDPDEGPARVTIGKVYDKLRVQLTDNCAKVLLALEDGENKAPGQLVGQIVPRPHSKKLVADFEYRLRFLCLLGLLTPVGGSEYAITKLGKAFLASARDRKDYSAVVFSGP
jgi:hypothetical protein